MFGEMGLLLGQPRFATVVSDGESQCYRLDRQGFDAVLQARPELAETLSRIATVGPHDFYSGQIAHRIDRSCREAGANGRYRRADQDLAQRLQGQELEEVDVLS